MGNPNTITDSTEVDFNLLANNTFVGFADLDASPTKAWIVQHRKEANNYYYFDMAFGKRPREELYQVNTDPYQVKNLAYNPKYSAVRIYRNRKLLSE